MGMYLKSCSEEQRDGIYADISVTEESLDENIDQLVEWTKEQSQIPEITGKAKWPGHVNITKRG